jgi:hypothetical protein
LALADLKGSTITKDNQGSTITKDNLANGRWTRTDKRQFRQKEGTIHNSPTTCSCKQKHADQWVGFDLLGDTETETPALLICYCFVFLKY